MRNQDIDEIRQAIQNELGKDKLNFNRFSELTNDLLALDQDAVRFSVDARHIHRLGFELVGKQETALSELIKNAYDADAIQITIDFKEYHQAGGGLIVDDNGSGMTEQVIRDAWMRLSTSDKKNNPISSRFGRSRAGRKGIGRFAVERLGERLILETNVAGEIYGHRVHFDWDQHFQHGRSLTHIANPIERFAKPPEEAGTRLIIERLRDKWTEKTLERVWKSVLLLQPPFKPPARSRAVSDDISSYEPDPGFQVVINGHHGDEIAQELSLEKTFLEHRVALIRGRIDNEGNGSFAVQSKKLGFEDTSKIDQKFSLIGKLEFEASYFIYKPSLISGFSLRKAEEMGAKYGGFRIYRDGFRVMPYGEPHDDWLKLAYDSARRSLLIPASNSNFFGQIELTSLENSLFEETISREGLIENEAYEELHSFVRICLEDAAKRIAAHRGRKQKAGQKDFEPKERKPSEILQEAIDDFEEETGALITDEQAEKEKARETLTRAMEVTQRFEEEAETKEKKHIRYEEMLRILASLGISISIFGHEVSGGLTRVTDTFNKLAASFEPRQTAGHGEFLSEMKEGLGRLYDLAAYINAQVDNAGSRNKSEIPLYGRIKKFADQFAGYLKTRGIKLSFTVEPPFLRTAPMHQSEIDSVLFNFLTNSVKAIERAKSDQLVISIKAGCKDGYAVITFQDTGTGVPGNIAEYIFDAFYTTTQYHEDEIVGPGSGLGLKIVSDIASANGGFVRIEKPEAGFTCRFDFGVPISDKQVG